MAAEKVDKTEEPSNKQNEQHLVFAVLWIVKCCVLYVFCAELFSIYLQPKYDCIRFDLDNWFDARVYFLIAAVLLAVGITLDFIMLVASVFSVRAAIGILCFSAFIHSTVILPQHATGIAMALTMKTPNPAHKCTVIFKPDPKAIHEHRDGKLPSSIATEPTMTAGTTSRETSLPTTAEPHNKQLLSGTLTQEVKYPERMLYRVLLVFSCIIVSVEVVYFVVAILFYVFLVWQPMPKMDYMANNPHAASPSNTLRFGGKSDRQNHSVFTENTQKSAKATVKIAGK